MPLSLPASPTPGQQAVASNGITYRWSGAYWEASSTNKNTRAIVAATAPTGPVVGTLWYNTTSGLMFVWNGTAWLLTSGEGNVMSLSGDAA